MRLLQAGRGHHGRRLWWFRIGGYGLHLMDQRRNLYQWSEPYHAALGLGPWKLKILTPTGFLKRHP